MQRAFATSSSLFSAFALGSCLAASCQEDGVTSVCPPLPLYPSYPLADSAVLDAAAGARDIDAALARAIDAGCATPPSSFPSEGGDGGAAGLAAIERSGETGAAGSTAGAAGHD